MNLLSNIYIIFLISGFSLASCTIYSTENADGSYSIGLDSDSTGQQANSILALLTKSAGYTLDSDYQRQSEPSRQYQEPEPEVSPSEDNSLESRDLLSPHLEILQLIEIFLKFKGELASSAYAIFNDNYDLIRSVYNTLISKLGTLHTFTLTGIKILRKILEFAVSLMAQWQITFPPVAVDFSVGGGGANGGASLQFNKNGINYSG